MLVLFLALLAVGVSADPYKCKSEDYYIDTNKGFQLQAASVLPNPNCLMMWYWRQDDPYYPALSISTSGMGAGDKIQFFSSNGVKFDQSFANRDLFNKKVSVAWPSNTFGGGGFTMTYTAAQGSKMALNISIDLKPFSIPAVATAVVTAKRGDQPTFLPPYRKINKGDSFIVQSSDQLFLKSGYPDNTILSNYFVFDNRDGACLGSMFSFDTETWIRKNITILAVDTVDLSGSMLVNDDNNNNAYMDYGILTGSPQTIALDATFGEAGWIGAKPQEQPNFPGVYLTKVSMQVKEGVTATLIAGGPLGDTKITPLGTYGNKNQNQLPQYIPSSVWTIMANTHDLDDDKVAFEIQPTLPGKSLAYNTRTGFIISDNYPFLSSNQSSITPFVMETGDSGPFTVAFTVTTKSPNKDATVVVDSGTGNPFTINLNTITVPYTKAFTTKKVSVVIHGGTGASNGTYVTYTVASTFNYPK